ncbi:MAG: peptide chain release factor 1 [Gemmatimonadetes bacterium]|nr:peptide chain release factor 1 [Gemmatimonadota bacterium]
MKPPALDERLEQRLGTAERRFVQLNELLSDPAVHRDPDKLKNLGQERAALEHTARVADEIRRVLSDLTQARELLAEGDSEMRDLALEEIPGLEGRLETLSKLVRELLIPKDPMEDRPAVVEIRAGTGGDEAGLFAAELMRMYTRFADRQGWSVELMNVSEGIPGSIKEAVFMVKGRGAYGKLRWESGVHRVQRVPATETQGRIHTSAATVAVLPEAEEVDVQIDDNDLRIDVFRSSGPGGQSVNTTDSAVRITHLPTGLVVSQQDEKSQHKNKAKALKVLRSRLLDLKIAEQESARARERKTQIGTGDRSAKIRTYNFPQSRVTDHRIGFTVHTLAQVMQGDLDDMISALRMAEQEERLEGATA